MEVIKLLIVDDQVLFINSLKAVLELKDKSISVIGLCYDGGSAIDFCRKHTPDVILMDVRMPELDGVTATRLIRQTHPGIKIIALTNFTEEKNIDEMLDAGADDIIMKSVVIDELTEKIREAAG